MQDVDNWAGYACVRAGSVWEIPAPSSQLCCELNLLFKKKKCVLFFFFFSSTERKIITGRGEAGLDGEGVLPFSYFCSHTSISIDASAKI